MPKSSRHRSGAQVFIIRKELLAKPVPLEGGDGIPLRIVESGPRDWRVAQGDVFLFTEGRRLSLRFVAFSEVLEVDRQQIQEEAAPLIIVAVTVQQPTALPEDLRLDRFMYSLTIISNFGHPWLHLRHKSRVPLVDLETLQQARIIWNRTIFFGLLRDLPGRWREFLEHESRALRARSHIGDYWLTPTKLDVEPVRELLTLVETTLLSPARLAADVHRSWQDVLGTDSVQGIQVVTSDSAPEEWNMVTLMREAARQSDTLEQGWRQLMELNLDREVEGGLPQWRPHRW